MHAELSVKHAGLLPLALVQSLAKLPPCAPSLTKILAFDTNLVSAAICTNQAELVHIPVEIATISIVMPTKS